eukprot:4892647-Heterocapsa_arctica.AAC.1
MNEVERCRRRDCEQMVEKELDRLNVMVVILFTQSSGPGSHGARRRLRSTELGVWLLVCPEGRIQKAG